MAVYQVLYWQDIPAQIRVYEGKRPKAYPMPDWFQQEIDDTVGKVKKSGYDRQSIGIQS
jgi:hypothetical protein